MNLAKHLVAVEELRALRQEWDAKSREPFDWEELGLPIAGRLVQLARHVADAVEGGEAEASLLRRALRYQRETEERSPCREWIDEAGRCLFMADVACRRVVNGVLDIDGPFGFDANIIEEGAIQRLCRWLLEEPGRRKRLFDHVWCKEWQLGDFYGFIEEVRMHLPAVICHLEGMRALLPAPTAEVAEDMPLEIVRVRVTAGNFGVIGRIAGELRAHLRAFDGGHLRGSYLIRRFQAEAGRRGGQKLFTDRGILCFDVADMADLIGVVEQAADSLAEHLRDGADDGAVGTPGRGGSEQTRGPGRPRNPSRKERDRLIREEYAKGGKSYREVAEALAERHKDRQEWRFTSNTVRDAVKKRKRRKSAGR